MGVFDGELYKVDTRYADGREERAFFSDYALLTALLETLKEDGGLVAAEVFTVHYTSGDRDNDLSFGNYWEDED